MSGWKELVLTHRSRFLLEKSRLDRYFNNPFLISIRHRCLFQDEKRYFPVLIGEKKASKVPESIESSLANCPGKV